MFVTTVFEGVGTGPGTYARYLWHALKDDPEFEFHVVAPEVSDRHPRLHAAGLHNNSFDTYRSVQVKGLEVAAGLGRGTIVHGNSAHSMDRFCSYKGPWVVQVNDYDVASFRSRVPSILNEHGLRKLASLGWRHMRERRVLNHAVVAVCNSEYTSSALRRIYRLPSERTRVIYKAVDTSAFARPKTFPASGAHVSRLGSDLLFVGTDWRTKGLDVLLQSLRSVATRVADVTLSVIGPSPDDARLRRLVRNLGLDRRVRLLGRLPAGKVAEYLWATDAMVLPSRREGLGVAVLEALAAGVPIVATKVGGIPELIRSREEGLLVPPEDPQALAEALVTILQDHDLRVAARSAGPKRASDFSLEAMLESIRALYRWLGGAPR